MTRLLLAGAGHAHAVVLLNFLKAHLPESIRVTLVAPQEKQVYSGMLPGVVAEHYAAGEARIDFAALAQRANVEFIEGTLAGLDPQARKARLADGREIDYEALSLNVGSLPDASMPGASRHAVAVKPFEEFLVSTKSGERLLAVIGAGAGGVELAMAFRHRGAEVTLYSERSAFPPRVEKRVDSALRRRQVSLVRMAATSIEDGPVVVAGTTRARYDAVILATGAVPLPWLASAGLASDERGFVLVDERLLSASHPDVFAAGDCASVRAASYPRSGANAVKQGAVLAFNLRAYFSGQAMRRYAPKAHALSLLSCGNKYAIALRGSWSAEGRWVWYWKDLIDRRWIRRFKV